MEVWEQIPLDAEAGARKLVAEYGDRLFRAAVLLCRDEHLAEDLVFRTFERVVDKIGQYDTSLSFWNWLYAIMLNFFRMDMRKSKASVAEDESIMDEIPALQGEELLGRLSQMDAATIRDAVERLAPPFRETVVLRYFEDKTLQEMSELMSVPVGTVKWRLHQARNNLERMLSLLFKGKEG